MVRKPKERVCAICGKPGNITALTMPLKWLGIPGNYAHPKCVKREKQSRRD